MTHAGRLGGLDLERLTPHVTCAAHDCHEKGPRGTSSEGKPTPPPGWSRWGRWTSWPTSTAS